MEINTATFNLAIVALLVFLIVLKQMNMLPKLMKINLFSLLNKNFKYGLLIALIMFFILTYFSINKIDLKKKSEDVGEKFKIGTISI